MVVKWQFTDEITSTVYTMDVNPVSGGMPSFKKNITQQATSAPNGVAVLFEGRHQVAPIEFQGVALDESKVLFLYQLWNLQNPVLMRDDLYTQMRIYITDLEFLRKRSVNYQWRSDYTVRGLITEFVSFD
jgi:hypothetical protein